jgi:hypothetical protein
MTPKEKAKELVGNFCNVEFLKDYEGMDYELAKECAIIAVDEILKAVESDWSFMEKRKEYWKQVKKEIENL